jgi:hypothetical protein
MAAITFSGMCASVDIYVSFAQNYLLAYLQIRTPLNSLYYSIKCIIVILATFLELTGFFRLGVFDRTCFVGKKYFTAQNVFLCRCCA